MEDVTTLARTGRLSALDAMRRDRINIFAPRRGETLSNAHSVLARLSDVRVRMGAHRMALDCLSGGSGGPLRLR